MLLDMKKLFDVNHDYISSWDGMTSVSILASGGGVFGLIASAGLRSTSATVEFLFWVSIFAWVTNLLGFLYSSYNSKPFATSGLVQHWSTITIFYLIATVLYGVYDAFSTNSQIHRFVFSLSVYTTVGYFEKMLCQITQLVSESKGGSGQPKTDGKANGDEVPLEEVQTKVDSA